MTTPKRNEPPGSEAAGSDSGVRAPPTRLSERLLHLGPGLIITGSIVGSGELIVTTGLGAKAGFSLLWLVVLGCFIKVFVQLELGRYAVASGETTLATMNSMPGPRLGVSWILWMWAAMFLCLIFQLAGILDGLAEVFVEMGVPLGRGLLATVTAIFTALLLVSGRYGLMERWSTILVFTFTLATVVAVAALQWTPRAITPGDLFEGLRFRLGQDFTWAFAAFGITGVGASELIYYPYWCLEKGYARHVGPRDDSPQWLARARGWLTVMKLDAWLSFVV